MFITFEGLDGSGKTTIINKLIERLLLLKPNLKYVLTREPGGKDVPEAEKIREIILSKNSNISPITEALLYSASRRIHLEKVIWPSLEKNHLLICDRYIDSFFAYQGFARNLGYKFVKKITDLIINKTIPDITFYLNVTPEQGKKRRLENRLIQDRLDEEKEDFHNKVYKAYQKLISLNKKRFIVINGFQSIDLVLEEIIEKLFKHSLFKKWWKEN
ncbi:dTMP kinase [Mycoplasmopsis hyopharyngis]|uniref:dTMP kinase n=1 Tax=Mycoplasmopsis hyopharyngis TaxID=29558 RepID=UPI0038738470